MFFTQILDRNCSGKSPVSLWGFWKLPNMIMEDLISCHRVIILVSMHFYCPQKPWNCQKSCFSLRFQTETAPVSLEGCKLTYSVDFMYQKVVSSRCSYVFSQKTRFLAIFHTFSIGKAAKSNKLFANTLAPLREVNLFAENFLLAYRR